MAKTINEPSNVTADMLSLAAEEVARMWAECQRRTNGRLQMASANDTIHFLHEEAGEVVKCAMELGLMGDKSYVRSAQTRGTVYTWKDLIIEIGDVLLMAMTLAETFDVDPSICLQASIDKFYARARAERDDAKGDHPQVRSPQDSSPIPFSEGWEGYLKRHQAGPLARGLSIIESDALARARDCEGFVPSSDCGDYCKHCRAHVDLHTTEGRSAYVQERKQGLKDEPPSPIDFGRATAEDL